jgi:hypothetical protein
LGAGCDGPVHRRIVGFGIHAGIVNGMAVCRMFNQAIRGQHLRKYLSSDYDPLYRFHQWEANLRVLDIMEVKTVPYVPVSHPTDSSICLTRVATLVGNSSRFASFVASRHNPSQGSCDPLIFQCR